MKYLLEKEVVLRSAKHIFNDHIREAPDTYLSSVIAHLFNILLASFPFIDLLNEGKITYIDNTVQSLISQKDKTEDEQKQVTPKQQ